MVYSSLKEFHQVFPLSHSVPVSLFCRHSKFAPKVVEGFLLGYDSNTKAYRVFNKSTGLVEVSCDIVFDETNGAQVEQVDLDELDDEEALCVALRNMSIGYVCPKESEEPIQAQDQCNTQKCIR